MNGIARDDTASLTKRKQGQTIVCATFVAVNPIEIEDSSGRMSLQSLPNDSVVSVGDTCLFLFDCADGSHSIDRITLIPSELVPVYQHLLQVFRESRHL